MRQKLTKLFIAVATVATTLLASCQQESDEILGNINGLDYRIHDNMTYTEMWDVLWNGYNQNYVGWETETIDWDEANATIRPQIVALDAQYDTLSKQGKLSPDSTEGKAIASKVAMLFHSAFDSLHDGHTWAYYTDRYTKKHEKMIPSSVHIKERQDSEKLKGNQINIGKYYYIDKGEVVAKSYKAFSTSAIAYGILDGIKLQMKQDILNGQQDEYLHECYNYLEYVITDKISTNEYNQLVFGSNKYEPIINKYGLFKMDFSSDPTMMMCFTSDNIAYFWMNSFDWPANIEGATPYIRSQINEIFVEAAKEWHDKVYEMHNNGTLKGVILDVRWNGGGSSDVLKYFAGSLFKGNRHQLGTQKFKNGIGRLDYTASVPFYLPCWGLNSEDISETIVILTNVASASCSELSTAAVKQHKNGISIGTRTYGAGAGLYSNGTYYPYTNYSGTIGIDGTTTVYAYIPVAVTYYDGGIGNIESKGIAPDIEVTFDGNLNQSTGRDNQFERAIDYIRSVGK